MKLYSIKLLTIVCEIPVQKNIIDILDKNHISGYTFYEVGGNGTKGIRGQGLQNEKNIKAQFFL